MSGIYPTGWRAPISCHHGNMKQPADSIQHTIRGVPPALDRVLGQKAAQLQKSLNQVILDELIMTTTERQVRADFSTWWGSGPRTRLPTRSSPRNARLTGTSGTERYAGHEPAHRSISGRRGVGRPLGDLRGSFLYDLAYPERKEPAIHKPELARRVQASVRFAKNSRFTPNHRKAR